MTRIEYRAARRLIRDNGTHALRWMTPDTRAAFERLIGQPDDPYAEILFFYRGHEMSIHDRLTFRHRQIRNIRA